MSNEELNTPCTNTNKYRSDEIGKIISALGKAQASYGPLIPNQDAPGGKFANLRAILSATQPALADNDLGFYQHIELMDDGAGAKMLQTFLGHGSGQWISSWDRIIPGKNDRQTGNIYETYKRFGALLVLGIAPSNNDPMAFDDNGNELADYALMADLKKPKSERTEVIDYNDVITTSQYDEILLELEGYEEIAKNIMEKHNIETLADLPRSEFRKACTRIREIKKANDDYLRRK